MREDVKSFISSMEGTTLAERRANAMVILMYDLVNKKEEVKEEPVVLAKSEEEYVPETPKKTRKKKVKEEVK